MFIEFITFILSSSWSCTARTTGSTEVVSLSLEKSKLLYLWLLLKGYRSWTLCDVNGSAGRFLRICALTFLSSYRLCRYSKARGAWLQAAVLSIADLSKVASFSCFSFLQLPFSISPEEDVGFPCCGSSCVGPLSNLGLWNDPGEKRNCRLKKGQKLQTNLST